jgi:hypothetical protein
MRWKTYLQRFDATWSYVQGPDNTVADPLSRMVHIDEEVFEKVEQRDFIMMIVEETELTELEEEGDFTAKRRRKSMVRNERWQRRRLNSPSNRNAMLGFSSTPETEEAMLYQSSTSEMEEKDFILNLEKDDPEELRKWLYF